MLDSVNPSQFLDAVILYQYWCRLSDRKLRKELNPVDIGRRILPCVTLAHSLDDGRDIQYDLVSRTLSTVAPRLKRGSLSSEAETILKRADQIHKNLCMSVQQQSPMAFEAYFESLEGIMRQEFCLLLPLGLNPDTPCSNDLLIAVWHMDTGLKGIEEVFVDVTDWFLESAHRQTSQNQGPSVIQATERAMAEFPRTIFSR